MPSIFTGETLWEGSLKSSYLFVVVYKIVGNYKNGRNAIIKSVKFNRYDKNILHITVYYVLAYTRLYIFVLFYTYVM